MLTAAIRRQRSTGIGAFSEWPPEPVTTDSLGIAQRPTDLAFMEYPTLVLTVTVEGTSPFPT